MHAARCSAELKPFFVARAGPTGERWAPAGSPSWEESQQILRSLSLLPLRVYVLNWIKQALGQTSALSLLGSFENGFSWKGIIFQSSHFIRVPWGYCTTQWWGSHFTFSVQSALNNSYQPEEKEACKCLSSQAEVGALHQGCPLNCAPPPNALCSGYRLDSTSCWKLSISLGDNVKFSLKCFEVADVSSAQPQRPQPSSLHWPAQCWEQCRSAKHDSNWTALHMRWQ